MHFLEESIHSGDGQILFQCEVLLRVLACEFCVAQQERVQRGGHLLQLQTEPKRLLRPQHSPEPGEIDALQRTPDVREERLERLEEQQLRSNQERTTERTSRTV